MLSLGGGGGGGGRRGREPVLDSCNLENDLSIYLVSSSHQVWLGNAVCFHHEAHWRTWEQSSAPASSAARAANNLQALEIWIKKNIPEVSSDLQAVPVRGHMVVGMHVLPVNVFLKTLLNNSYSHH